MKGGLLIFTDRLLRSPRSTRFLPQEPSQPSHFRTHVTYRSPRRAQDPEGRGYGSLASEE